MGTNRQDADDEWWRWKCQESRLVRTLPGGELENMALEPPYKPVVNGTTDTANFSPGEMLPEVNYVDDGSGWFDNFATSVD